MSHLPAPNRAAASDDVVVSYNSDNVRRIFSRDDSKVIEAIPLPLMEK